jgi:hypothetical protein
VRLRVTEVGPERLALQVVQQPAAPGAPPPAVGLALPGGARFRVEPEEEAPSGARQRGAEGRRSIALRFDSPALGRIDFLIDLDPAAATATVGVAAGAEQLARSAANDLRSGLEDATARPATVRVEPRAEALDVRA